MKKLITMVMLAVLLTGCVAARYNAASKDVNYTRIGDLETDGVYIFTDPNGAVHIEIEKTKSSATEDIIALLKLVFEAGLAAGGVR